MTGVIHKTSCWVYCQCNTVSGINMLLRDHCQAIDMDLKQGCKDAAG